MNLRFVRIITHLLVAGGLLGTIGCASVDRFGSKLDMEAGRHLGEDGSFIYEGHLEAVETIGAMQALQFDDGKFYDVVAAPAKLFPGDVVRIYKTDGGYEAHLWKNVESQEKLTSSGSPTKS